MNAEEALAICRMAKGAFPATTMDDFTPDAWALALEEDRFVDARDALKALMRERTFIHVSDIVAGIRRIRHARVTAYGALPEPPPDLDPDDTGALQQWEIDTTRRIADGDLTTDNPQPIASSPWSDAVSPVEVAAERQATRERVAEIRASLAKRESATRPTFAELTARLPTAHPHPVPQPTAAPTAHGNTEHEEQA